MDLTFNKNQFSARYMKIMVLTCLFVLVISSALLFIQNREKIQNEKARITEEFINQSRALDRLVVSVVEHLNLFSHSAESFYLKPEEPADSLYQSLRDKEGGGYTLDYVSPPYTTDMVGNLSGKTSINSVSEQYKREVQMALSLNSLFVAAKKNIPSSSWIYYTSKSNFINIYPWVNSRDFMYVDELKTHEFYTKGLPEVNPERKSFWTEPYIDEAGQGFMVTAAQPVYDNDRFLGTVAIDITLNELVDFVSAFTRANGTMMIVNEDDQIIAAPGLNDLLDKISKENDASHKLPVLDDVLPDALDGTGLSIFANSPQRIHSDNNFSYIWYGMESSPWRVLYIYDDSQFGVEYWARLNMDFFLLVIALGVMIFASSKVTFREFIYPAEKLVNHIAEQSQEEKAAEGDKKVPPPWLPWFHKISRIFAENHRMIQEIKEKNQILLEKNTALERYMPKTIVVISVQQGSGSTTIGNFLCRSFLSHGSDSRSTAYVEFPATGSVFKTFGVPDSEEKIINHPSGYDIWGGYDFGAIPDDARSTMLANKLLENYNNVVINVCYDRCSAADIEVFLRYAKVVLMVTPTQLNLVDRFAEVCREVAHHIRQDKTTMYTVSSDLNNSNGGPVDADFSLPYIHGGFAFSCDEYNVPETAQPVIEELIDRVERIHQISVFIPTTIDIDQVVDTSEYVERTMALFGEKFGGATCSEANGVWNSSNGDLVTEAVNIVVSYTTEDGLNTHVNDVIEFVKDVKQELRQDAMAIEINKKLILI